MRVPQELILFGRQLGYFERYAVALAPDWVLGADPLLLRNIADHSDFETDEVTGTGPARPSC